ncbi:MAG: zinc protease [Flavobacteriales bacterium]|jgi:zinc protease
MIAFDKFVLENGLRVIVHQDKSTPIVAFNLMYDVGARDESPEKTGFAHLFEHLMFGGSENIPDYDIHVDKVGGQNNAFTSNDITNYYITLPKDNLETAFWLESDRMKALAFTPKSLEVQRSVVIEEFKQRYLNQPYGDVHLLLRELSYKQHPYRWATIGKEISHIEEAVMDDVKKFFYKHYAPNNAILVVAGDVELANVKSLTEKYFNGIPKRDILTRNLSVEPIQTEARVLTVERDVPVNALYKTYHMCARDHKDYHAYDLLSDLLSRGQSSRLFQSLVKEAYIFSDISAYVGGDSDPGLFYFSGKIAEDVSFELAEQKLYAVIVKLLNEGLTDEELQKVKNKVTSVLLFSEMSVLNKAINLASAELMGGASMVNEEQALYNAVSVEDVLRCAKQIFTPENSNTLYYKSKNK